MGEKTSLVIRNKEKYCAEYNILVRKNVSLSTGNTGDMSR